MSDPARPTPWIIATAACALVAIGFAIWAFTLRSDRDDVQAQLDRTQQRSAAQRSAAAEEEERLEAYGQRERVEYRAVRRGLVRERALAADLRQDVRREAARLEATRRQLAGARNEEDRRAAELARQRARTRLAIACSSSAVDALQRFFDAPTPRVGATLAVRQLRRTREECRRAADE